MPPKSSHDMLVNVKSQLSRAEIDQQELELEASAKFLFKNLDNAERVKLGLKRRQELVAPIVSNNVIAVSLEIASVVIAISAFTWVFSSGNVELSLIVLGIAIVSSIFIWLFLRNN